MTSSATLWYRLWLFSTMLSRMAKERCRMETSPVGWLTYPAIFGAGKEGSCWEEPGAQLGPPPLWPHQHPPALLCSPALGGAPPPPRVSPPPRPTQLGSPPAALGQRACCTCWMNVMETVSQDTTPWSMSSRKAVRVNASISL